jgi:hypothetical protein
MKQWPYMVWCKRRGMGEATKISTEAELRKSLPVSASRVLSTVRVKGKVKISLLQAMEVHRVERG